MLIYGEPGTGKTYFVECLENEVGVPCRVLSASEKEKGEDKLDYLKKVIDDVKAKKSPCILLIDEAESTVLDRTSAMASSEDRHVTNYLLQEINELRKSHPYVLIVVATNYIDRIDDAILRPGRVDIIIEMKPMSEKGRKALILRELIKEKIELELEPSDWEELMKITESFIPICISQAIIGTNRVYLPRIRRTDPDAAFDKELLFQKLREEALRYGRFKNLIKDRNHRH
jgi:SpoVK/Ycf46/Vps4 family AAA+-type ATPase